LPSRKARDVKKALQKKGFRQEERDHWFYIFYHDGKKSPIHTKISHSVTDISKRICGAMAHQMRLTNPQFEQFVDCKLDAKRYVSILIEKGITL
jgi:hypothetical protein